MNDNDIIKALDCCCDRRCGECVRLHSGHREEWVCSHEIMGLALALINRQKAEIERLNHIRAELSKEISALREEIDSLKRFEAMRIEAEELFWEREEMFAQSDKERQEAEAFEKLMQIAEMTEEQNGNL